MYLRKKIASFHEAHGLLCMTMDLSFNIMDTTPPPHKLLNVDIPEDNEIKEILKERDKNAAQCDETDKDSDISSDDDIEGSMEQVLWDALFPKGKPYTNTTEDLRKILRCLPLRYSLRQKTINPTLNESDQKSFLKNKSIIESRLVDEEIDQAILMENFERVRDIIKEKIIKKDKNNIVNPEIWECVVKLERMEL